MYLRSITISLIITLLLSCEERFTWPLQESTADLIAVEAIMTNENKNHLIRLTKPFAELNETPLPVSGATVAINTKNGLITTTEFPPGSGKYYTDSMRFVTGLDYNLTINYQSRSYFATASQPPVEPLPAKNLVYRKVDDGIYALNYPESGVDANYVEYYIYWQHVLACENPGDCQAGTVQYDLKNIDIHEQFKPDQEQILFPTGTIILRKKYSVDDEYRDYLRGMLSETNWRGGVFDIYPANAPTNLSNGAIGFFAVSTVISDTIIVVP